MRKRGWTEEKEKQAVALYQTTALSAGQVARAVGGVLPWMVLQALRKHGVAPRKGRRTGSRFKLALSAEERDTLVARYEAGESTERLATVYGSSSATIAQRLKDAGAQLRAPGFQQGEEHHAWKGGRIVMDSGYVLVLIRPDDPYYPMAQIKTTNARYVLEHRLVMARHLGRCLTEDETVHHVDDRDRANNDISNLQLRQGNHGKGAAFKCLDCGSHNVTAVPLTGISVRD